MSNEAGAQGLAHQFAQEMIQNLRQNVAEEKARLAGAQVPSQGLEEAAKAVLYAVKCDGYSQFTEREEDAFRALAKVLGEELWEPISVYEHTDKKVARLETHLNTIRDYVLAAQQTPITRESIQATAKIDEAYWTGNAAPIPNDLVEWRTHLGGDDEGMSLEDQEALLNRCIDTETALKAQTLTAQTLFDEAHGLYNLVLSETGK
jgi:hypothetical protein